MQPDPPASFLSLPHELREAVVAHLHTPAQLLSLALTCRRLCLLVIPDYLHYCRIRTFICAEELWDHLIASPVLARNVKEVILCRRDYRIPKGFHIDDSACRRRQELYHEGMLQLAEALNHMPNLRSFQFPPGVRGKNDEVWEALAESCPNLRELVVWDWCPSDFEFRPIYESKMFDLQNLTVFKLYNAAYAGSIVAPPTHRLRHFLLNCPNLEELVILFQFVDRRITTPLDSVFDSVDWPRLRSLELSYVSCGADIASRFFRRHPSIEKIHLFDDFYDRVDMTFVEQSTLPRLKTFHGTVASLKALATAGSPLQDVTIRWVLLNQDIVLTLVEKFEAIKLEERKNDPDYWMIRIFESVPRVVLTDGSARVRAQMSSGRFSFQWETI
ncbi:hypothetical protein OE88DRAFT_1651111 [Heliocybe sulcata]|uniref:F-box domain-containing protein n=1 Tax=Heliocybe sulcata TaxID=5364 RepID=A0A5C3NJJ9_9AGAM|nr:hypothetical protein OE88DRAFT_1651111 [Heliocybe sulcata]